MGKLIFLQMETPSAPGSSAAQNVEVGPIWNQRHAEEKAAEYVRNHPEFQWTGHWWTTEPGMMSVIQRQRTCQWPPYMKMNKLNPTIHQKIPQHHIITNNLKAKLTMNN